MYTEVQCEEDIDNLQHSLDTLSEWSQEWQLSISVKKCCTLDVGIGNKDTFYPHVINENEIEHVDNVRDLGVQMDTKLGLRLMFLKL